MTQQVFKGKLLATSAAVVMALTGASATAAEVDYDIYGNIHLSINAQDSNDNDLTLNTNTSAIGIKGSKKLDDGLSVIYQLEYQIDPTLRNSDRAFVDRDQWVGFKGDFGKIIFGTASSNYKSKGGKIDPMYRTPLEGRGRFMATQSRMHAGAGLGGGRLTKSVNYTSPKMNGFSIQANATLAGADDATGIGIRHESKDHLFYADTFNNSVVGYETAVKVGGFYKFDGFTIAAQFENSEDVVGQDYWFLAASYKMDKDDTLKFSMGEADGVSSSFALMYDHKLDKSLNMYVGYGNKDIDAGGDDSLLTLGMRYKF